MKKKTIDTIKEIFLGIFFVILISFQLISFLYRFIEHRYERALPSLSNYVDHIVSINSFVDLLHIFLFLIIAFFPLVLSWLIFFPPERKTVNNFLNFYSLTGQYLMMFAITVLVCCHVAKIEIFNEGFFLIFLSGLFLVVFSEITYLLKLKQVSNFKNINYLYIVIIFFLLFLYTNHIINNPVRKRSLENSSLIHSTIYTETNINNAILRYKEFSGTYPEKLEDLIDKNNNNLYLDKIPVNPLTGNKVWDLNIKNGKILNVDASYKYNFIRHKFYSKRRKIRSFYKIFEFEIILTVILFFFILIFKYKKINKPRFEKFVSVFSFINSLMFFLSLMLIIYISRPFWVIILKIKWIP